MSLLALAGLGLGMNAVTNLMNFGMQYSNYNYQKNLQKQIFNREDTSIQRRIEDLQAAGLNKNLAAGSGAGAGSVVSTSAPQAQNNDLGAMLDYKAATSAINKTEAETNNLNIQNQILKNQANISNLDYELSYLDFLNQLGFPASYSDGQVTMDGTRMNNLPVTEYGHFNLDFSPRSQLYQFGYKNAENNASLLQGDVDWQGALNSMKLLGPALQALIKLAK